MNIKTIKHQNTEQQNIKTIEHCLPHNPLIFALLKKMYEVV